ncbi:MAG: hypothetical protein ACQEQV_04455 [Fibrobacterota bacterium]
MHNSANILDSNLSGTYIFISFDLVNSTAFKLKDPYWPLLFNRFFDYCRSQVKGYFTSAVDWKMVGDEILFYMPLQHMETLAELPSRIFSILRRNIIFIKENTAVQELLSVKATLWCAYMREQRDFSPRNHESNYLIRNTAGNSVRLDFLGPHIDTGFRLGSFGGQGKLVIGAHLAVLISDAAPQMRKHIRIVSYEQLKGVWNGRPYPVVWYHEHWHEAEKLFLYDEPITDPLARRILAEGICSRQNVGNLQKVFTDLFRSSELQTLKQGVKEMRANKPETLSAAVPIERLSELHLVAFCLTDSGQKLLVGKRREDHLWDFGCSSLQLYRTIEESLEQGYRDDFGITLRPFENHSYPPVVTYSFTDQKSGKTIPGIMFLAKVCPEEARAAQHDPFTYTEIRWLSRGEAQRIPAEKAVPGFHERLAQAFSTYNKGSAE